MVLGDTAQSIEEGRGQGFGASYVNGVQDSVANGVSKAGRVGGTMAIWTKNKGAALKEWLEDIKDAYDKKVDKMDKWAEGTRFGRFFALKFRKSKLSSEIRAGTISFAMIAYILAVNPQILTATGGTCDAAVLCGEKEYQLMGNACLFTSRRPAAQSCMSELRLDLTTATAAVSLISSFIMGFFANLPMGLAPGMGINIYVAYQVVAQGLLTYQQTMVAIFLEGFIFIVLSVTGVRGGMMKRIPSNIAFAGSVGIGLLLAFTGLRNLGVIVFDSNTLVTLGGCPASDADVVFVAQNTQSVVDLYLNATLNDQGNFTISTDNIQESAATVYACGGGVMRSPSMWLGIAGGFVMAILSAWRVKGALFIGVAFITVISWIPGHAASYLGADSSIPGGQIRLDTFKQVVAAPSLSLTGLAWDWSAVGTGEFWLVLLTLLYIDILDCTGILLSMSMLLDDCMKLDQEEGEPYTPFVSENKEFKGQQWAFLSDGIGIICSSMMGITPVNVYLESAAGIEEGGRTGIVPMVVSAFFFVSLFFSPIFSSIPPYATGPALILVGVMLIAHVDHIQWDDAREAIPAFLTIIIMPFTLSVAYGVIAGLMAYVALHLPSWISHYWHLFSSKYLKKHDEDSDDDRALTTSSLNRSQIRRRAVHRKVFGASSFRGSDDVSVLSRNGRDESRATSHAKTVPKRGKVLHKSQTFGARGSVSHSPAGTNPIMGSSPGRNEYINSNAASIISHLGVNQRTNLSLTRSRTFADLASATVEQRDRDAKEEETGVQLFGDFQLLDLDLGSSGYSDSDQEEHIELHHDGSLRLASTRHSADMSIFTKIDGDDDEANPMSKGKELQQEGMRANMDDLSAARDSFVLSHRSHPSAEAATSSIEHRLMRKSSSFPVKESRQEDRIVTGSFSLQPSPFDKKMTKTVSEAALRLKQLFDSNPELESVPSLASTASPAAPNPPAPQEERKKEGSVSE